PMMWIMCSTEDFNDIADARTRARANEPWESYVSRVSTEAASPTLSTDPSRNHVVIIMGYNETTNEIAFSDSWGAAYHERWITLPEAEQVSLKRFYIISP